MGELGALPPQTGARFQVIGGGLPRSGTNSFCAAISTLLGGPAYQAAVQSALSPTSTPVLNLTQILQLRAQRGPRPTDQPSARWRQLHERLLKLLSSEMNGYVASADAPLCLFVPELLELFPSAIVLCSTRSRASWAASMWKAAKLANVTLLRWLYFWVPVLRHSPGMWAAQEPVWRELYDASLGGETEIPLVWDRHHQWLRDNVPPEKLFFVDLNDGWEPLCAALNVGVPDLESPRLNDGAALEKVMGELAIKGLIRWAGVLVVGVLLVCTLSHMW